MLIALATVLSMIKIWQMPLGGSVTLLSMLPVTLIAIEYGVGWGLGGAFVCSLIQTALSFSKVLSWGLSPLAVVGCLLFDYAIAFTVLGFAGLFRKKGVPGICAGVATALVLRFICHIVSGVDTGLQQAHRGQRGVITPREDRLFRGYRPKCSTGFSARLFRRASRSPLYRRYHNSFPEF